MASCDAPEKGVIDVKFMSGYGRGRLTPDEEQEYCPEAIGFESMNLKRGDNFSIGISPESEIREFDENRRRKRKEAAKLKVEKRPTFPPLITTLNCNGEPRFGMMKESSGDGRMQMQMVTVTERKEIFRCTRGDGRLRMVLVESESEDDGSSFDDGDDTDNDDGSSPATLEG